MKRDYSLITKRNRQINLDYAMMDLEGLKHHTIMKRLSDKYFLQPRTIFAIVSGEYDRRLKPISKPDDEQLRSD